MYSRYISIDNDGSAEAHSIDQPKGTLHSVKVLMDTIYIVIKVPGHQYWRARGEQSYAPAEYQLYEVIDFAPERDRATTTAYEVKRLFEFPVRQDEVNTQVTLRNQMVRLNERRDNGNQEGV